jgi:predicted tellurium resistance membrane protein TerC
MEHLFSVESLIALLTLTALEIVLGIDNIVFLAILTGKLPEHQRARARQIGLGLAMLMRIGLLLAIKWIMGLTAPLFAVFGHSVSGRDLILLIGGLFLIAKSTHEIHEKLEGHGHGPQAAGGAAKFGAIVAQIVAIDLVFSLDSVITAVGMAQHIEIMIAAVIVAVLIMMSCSGAVSAFVERHPTIKMLALAFLLLIGVMLLAEGFDKHIQRGYIYFAMAFSLGVEMLNIRAGRKAAKAGHA